jgi:hypothetical protein
LKQSAGPQRIVDDPWTPSTETADPMTKLKAPWNERNGRFSLLKAIVFVGLFAPAAWLAFELATGMFTAPATGRCGCCCCRCWLRRCAALRAGRN